VNDEKRCNTKIMGRIPSVVGESLSTVGRVTMFSDLLREDRQRTGLTVEQAARILHASRRLHPGDT
jgi:hypothetical protein